MNEFNFKEWSLIEGLLRRRLKSEERRFNKEMPLEQRKVRAQYITELNNLLEKVEEIKLSL